MLRTVHAAVQNGDVVPTWPNIVPHAYRQKLVLKLSLRDTIAEYSASFSQLVDEEREAVVLCFRRQNRIRSLLAGTCSCETADQLPAGIGVALRDLSKVAFRLLKDLGIRDQQYQVIYSALGHKVCPFCGLHMLDSTTAPREALDHYLLRDLYPFSGSNLKNLGPACSRCNSAYKGESDMLWDGAMRRRAFYPYDHTGVGISLMDSQPFGGTRDDYPLWKVSFVPDSVEAQTWDAVFKIRERYARDVLEDRYESWCRNFGRTCKRWGAAPTDPNNLIAALDQFRGDCEDDGFSERGFLKAAVFEMLICHCQQGNQRLIHLLLNTIQDA